MTGMNGIQQAIAKIMAFPTQFQAMLPRLQEIGTTTGKEALDGFVTQKAPIIARSALDTWHKRQTEKFAEHPDAIKERFEHLAYTGARIVLGINPFDNRNAITSETVEHMNRETATIIADELINVTTSDNVFALSDVARFGDAYVKNMLEHGIRDSKTQKDASLEELSAWFGASLAAPDLMPAEKEQIFKYLAAKCLVESLKGNEGAAQQVVSKFADAHPEFAGEAAQLQTTLNDPTRKMIYWIARKIG